MNLLIDLLATQLHQVALSPELRARLTPEVLLKLHKLAKRHDLAHVLGKALMENGVEIPEELAAEFKKADMLAVYRCAQQKQTLEELGACLNRAKIPHIPLKGAVLRAFYPLKTMRTSCDVDVLVQKEDLERACAALAAAGYQVEEKMYHDVTLISPTKVHLELHFSLREDRAAIDALLDRAWDFAVQEADYQYALTKTFFVFQFFAHLSYHFLNGGPGLRSLMDIWVMERKMGVTYLDAEDLLNEGGISQFAEAMTNLTHTCFDGAPEDAYSKPLLDYILVGGSYGTAQGKIAIKKTEKGGTVGYVFRRLFLPYKTMKRVYPVLERAPVLLPFCWIHRWFLKLFTGRGRQAAKEIKTARGITGAQMEEVQTLRAYLGL